jgi:hypothetical protein
MSKLRQVNPMKKIVTYIALFLLPFFTISVFAKSELPIYAPATDHVITHEVDDGDGEGEKEQDNVKSNKALKVIGILLLIGLVIFLIVVIVGGLLLADAMGKAVGGAFDPTD